MFRQGVLLIIISMFLMAATCERPLDLGIEEPEPRLVVVSNFTNNQALEVVVSKTKSILSSTETTYIIDANVELFQEDDFLETLELVPTIGKLNPYYTTRNFQPEANVVYHIMVEAPGFDPVMAQSHIPGKISINTFDVSNLVTTPTNEGNVVYGYDVLLSFDDPAAEDNYYHLRFFQQIIGYFNEEGDTTLGASYLQQIAFNSNSDNNFLTAYFDGGVLFEDGPLNGKTITYTFPLQVQLEPSSELLGQIFVELRTVSEDYYLYHNSLSRQQSDPNLPFNEPVIIYNNIKNGRGIFAGYSTSLDSIPVIN